MRGFPSRAAVAVALAFALLAALSVAKLDKVALALTSREAATVVDLIEKLKTEFGDFAYDDDEADEWFEKDAASQKLITKSGFNQKNWKTAVDETMKGFFATIPEAEIKTVLDGARQRTESATGLNAEQKKALLELIEEQRKEILALREGGKPFVGVVAPFEQRIRKLTMDNLSER
ncbi:hypothetical protein [Bradyrhizobium sp. sGM-13]|uniref:hypothetical protein n=1 Tax=Bradyrhizobium sp. sGM-13 TaxID=2831781 RepID=UPI001BCB1043|nr:hypothetical protein [Bradyrhizobium sp. sGM-13]